MPENRNSYRDTGLEDTLAQIRSEIVSKSNGNTSQKKLTPEAMLPAPESVELTDVATIDTDRHEATEDLEYSDAAAVAGFLVDDWQVADGDLGISELKLFLKADNNTNDSSGNSNNVTNSVGTHNYRAGELNYSLENGTADGNTASKEVPHAVSLNWGTNGAHAISIWIKVKATPAGTRYILCKGNNTGQGERAPLLFTNANLIVGYRKSVSAVANNTLDAPSNTLEVGNWVHIVVQFDGTSTMEVWKNGVRVANTALASGALFTNSQSFWIGKASGSSGVASAAWFEWDDLRAYSRTLTSTEIAALYNNGLVGIGSLVTCPARVGFSQVQ